MKQLLGLLFLFMTLLISACAQDKPFANVGDIPFDETRDDMAFKICDEHNMKQNYVRYSSDKAPGYENEKRGLERAILSKYSFPENKDQNGYVTLRFIVNCEGETGRFRIEEMDADYQPIQFDTKISDQLLEIVKNLEEWTLRKNEHRSFDFYQYLSFKIRNGQIEKIMP